jgi:hypothetical protein
MRKIPLQDILILYGSDQRWSSLFEEITVARHKKFTHVHLKLLGSAKIKVRHSIQIDGIDPKKVKVASSSKIEHFIDKHRLLPNQGFVVMRTTMTSAPLTEKQREQRGMMAYYRPIRCKDQTFAHDEDENNDDDYLGMMEPPLRKNLFSSQQQLQLSRQQQPKNVFDEPQRRYHLLFSAIQSDKAAVVVNEGDWLNFRFLPEQELSKNPPSPQHQWHTTTDLIAEHSSRAFGSPAHQSQLEDLRLPSELESPKKKSPPPQHQRRPTGTKLIAEQQSYHLFGSPHSPPQLVGMGSCRLSSSAKWPQICPSVDRVSSKSSIRCSSAKKSPRIQASRSLKKPKSTNYLDDDDIYVRRRLLF